MKPGLTVRVLDEREHESWGRFVADAQGGSIYSTPAYLSALCDVTGARFSVVGVCKGQQLVGGIALYEEASLGGLAASYRYLLNYHGPVVRASVASHAAERASRQVEILQALIEVLDRWPNDRLQLHIRHTIGDMRPFQARGWDVSPSYSYLVPLQGVAQTWDRIDQNLRRLIKRASEAGLTFSEDDDFDALFRLHLDVHRRKGAPLYLPEAGFRRYFENLRSRELCRLYHVRAEGGRSVAAQLVLTGPHAVSHTVCAASDTSHLSMGSTPFLRWKVFEALSSAGYEANDLTGAALGEVTRFKSQLGGDLVTNWVARRPDRLRYRLFSSVLAIREQARSLAASGRRLAGLGER